MQNGSIRKALADRYAIAQLLTIGSLLLSLGCGEPAGPDYARLAITTRWVSNAVLDVPYSDTLVATGGDSVYSWSVTVGSLPTGLSLTASTGIISGTSTVLGSNTFTIQVASGDGQTDTQELTITVATTPILQPDELCSDYPDSAIATFEDANLEAVIRRRLSLGAEENLTCDIVSGLTELDANPLNSLKIKSVVGIQNLTSLDSLYLGDNSIRGIGPLGGLTSLRYLYLNENLITDISALSGLTNLTSLRLDNNPNLTDIQPLLDNTGLGAGDTVNLEFTGVSCTHVAALEAKGMTVQSDCP